MNTLANPGSIAGRPWDNPRGGQSHVGLQRKLIDMGTIIGYIIIGLIGGAIAKAILPGKQGGGWLATILLGIVGALLGGFVGGALLNVHYDKIFSVSGLITTIIGSLVVLVIWRLISRRSAGVRA
jgi:uncharacterized membrane protein YeaQ/YmgE (transglycosylase-associated protein family)